MVSMPRFAGPLLSFFCLAGGLGAAVPCAGAATAPNAALAAAQATPVTIVPVSRDWPMKLSSSQAKRLNFLLDGADQAERGRDPVKAFLYIKEALRVEQLWSNNLLGDDSPANLQLKRYTAALLHQEGKDLITLLHSKRVPLTDKVNLVHVLEDDIILNYPGMHGDELMGGAFSE